MHTRDCPADGRWARNAGDTGIPERVRSPQYVVRGIMGNGVVNATYTNSHRSPVVHLFLFCGQILLHVNVNSLIFIMRIPCPDPLVLWSLSRGPGRWLCKHSEQANNKQQIAGVRGPGLPRQGQGAFGFDVPYLLTFHHRSRRRRRRSSIVVVNKSKLMGKHTAPSRSRSTAACSLFPVPGRPQN